MTYWESASVSNLKTYFPYAAPAPMQYTRISSSVRYPMPKCKWKRKRSFSLFFFFPMDGFTLGIPSIFKIRISTLTLLTSLSVRSQRRISLIDNSLHCLLFLLSALSSLSLFRFLTLSRLFPMTANTIPTWCRRT